MTTPIDNPAMDELLVRLGADPADPPPPPDKIDIDVATLTHIKGIQGPITMTINDKALRVSFKLTGVDPDVALAAERLVKVGQVKTRDEMIDILEILGTPAQ